MQTSFNAADYVMAIARALNMPDKGITSMSFDWSYGDPGIIRIEYIAIGNAELMDVLPQVNKANDGKDKSTL